MTVEADTRERATACMLGELVVAIGRSDFPARFLDLMRVLTGAELCSVFRFGPGGSVELILSAGATTLSPDFSLGTSRDYARLYWRSDRQLTQALGAPCSNPSVLRRQASEIADPSYREACYDRAGVVERVSILWPGSAGLLVSGYRTTRRRCHTCDEADRLEWHGGLLKAVLEQHLRAGTAVASQFDEPAIVDTLVGFARELSGREAEIAAGLILGETQSRIAQAKRISPATAVTYRRRAYSKLGVTNRRELVALHRRLLSGMEDHGAPKRG